MSVVLGIDPGPVRSAWVLLDPTYAIVRHDIEENTVLFADTCLVDSHLAIEMIASYGMPVGAEIFETCVWIGRFVERWERGDGTCSFVYRKDVKLHLCGTPRAKDSNIRQALIDKLGAPGTKAAKGPTYGIHKDEWAALAVAVTYLETQERAAPMQ